jgi:ParB family chromosome partitioning protein
MAKTSKKDALGQGIKALLGNIDIESDINPARSLPTVTTGSITEIPIEQITPNPFQPRIEFDIEKLQELADSIYIHGVIQPITVRLLGHNEYQLIAGERRWRATQLAGMEQIPAYIRTADDQQMLEMALIENIQREDLNPMEVALNYQRLISECSLTQNDLAVRLGKGRTTITNFLRLLKLPPDIQAGLKSQKIAMGHARALIEIAEVDVQLSIYQQAIAQEWSVRQVENAVRLWRESQQRSLVAPIVGNAPELSVHLRKVQNNLEQHFGTKVQLRQSSDGKGQININFASNEELNRILDMMNYES